jgi:hypothetical protein
MNSATAMQASSYSSSFYPLTYKLPDLLILLYPFLTLSSRTPALFTTTITTSLGYLQFRVEVRMVRVLMGYIGGRYRVKPRSTGRLANQSHAKGRGDEAQAGPTGIRNMKCPFQGYQRITWGQEEYVSCGLYRV